MATVSSLRLHRGAALLLLSGMILVANVAASAPPPDGPAAQASGPVKWRERLHLDRQDATGSTLVAVALTPDGKVAITADERGTIRVWNTRTGNELAILKGTAKIRAIRTSADGKTFSVVGSKSVQWRESGTGKLVRGLPWALQGPQAITLGPDGKTAAVVCKDGRVQFWQFGGKPQAIDLGIHKGEVTAVALAANGKAVATGGVEGTIKVWDVAAQKESASLRPKGGGLVRAVGFTPDGKGLVSAHGRYGIHAWDLASGKERVQLRGTSQTFLSLAVSPDSRTVIAGTANGAVRVWDLATGDPIHHFKSHTGQVIALAFAANGDDFASASTDATANLWRPEGSLTELPEEPVVAAAEMEILIQDLHGKDQVRAVQAIQALTRTPRQTMTQLKKLLRPIAPAPADRVEKLVTDLDSNRFATREKAHRELQVYGDRARATLKLVLKRPLNLEVQRRVKGLLERLDKEDTPEVAFQRRAVEVLEKIAAREARAFLQRLSSGVAEARLTRNAQEALKRLDE